MTNQTPQAVAETFFHRIATADDVNEIAALVSENVDWLVVIGEMASQIKKPTS
ncbi:hypothetical protein [Kosakonia cowanii]|jgi:hypothetical protein|uniref:hypothetical protein n=1 Tax=Kosakonia cowanii TaxID=208223 RepID=UPI0015E42583|nr:hypothetical protein [Kosakonia cowanii]MDP9767971.1 hypothetical protein [Atlantibacter hermannii]